MISVPSKYIKAAKFFAGTNDPRPHMNYIHFNADKQRIEASDGYMILVIPHEMELDENRLYQFPVPNSFLGDHILINPEDDSFECYDKWDEPTSKHFAKRHTRTKYPDIDEVVGELNEIAPKSVGITPELIGQLCKACGKDAGIKMSFLGINTLMKFEIVEGDLTGATAYIAARRIRGEKQ